MWSWLDQTKQTVTHLFHFIGPASGYTCTLHKHSAITRLGWLVCFSRASFANSVNSRLRQWEPWRALHQGGPEAWVWNSPQWWGDVCYAIQTCLGLWALLGLIASPNSPNGGFNLPPASYPPPPPTSSFLPTPSTPITCHQWYYSGLENSCSKSSSVG